MGRTWKWGRQGLVEATPEHDTPANRAKLCVVNACITPVLLVLYALRIYCLPCLEVYFKRLVCAILCAVCNCSCFMFSDKNFPPTDASIGEIEAKGKEVKWKRGSLLGKSGGRMKLFSGKIEPSDVAQGALGDCWLLSAIAALSEFNGAIQAVFANRDVDPRGKYSIRLFDHAATPPRWVRVTVDDRIPCDASGGGRARPMFTAPSGDELWVMILEKAFAKLCGSYANLEGGHALWALHCMTGDEVIKYSRDDTAGAWEACEMKPRKEPKHKRDVGFFHNGNTFDDDNLFDLLKKYSSKQCVLGAGTRGKDDTLTEGRGKGGGIVPGHAYSILAVREIRGNKLLQLRNPWGSFEWKGDWSDASDTWKKNPAVKALIRPKDDPDDGIFWMCYADFLKHFDTVDCCIRETGMDDLVLDVMEDRGTIGPCLGCVWGCIKYWVCCFGCYKLWFSRKSDKNLGVKSVAQVAPEHKPMDR